MEQRSEVVLYDWEVEHWFDDEWYVYGLYLWHYSEKHRSMEARDRKHRPVYKDKDRKHRLAGPEYSSCWHCKTPVPDYVREQADEKIRQLEFARKLNGL